MFIKLILSLFLLIAATFASANEWTTISPLPHCPQLTIEYQLRGELYYVRYRPSPQDLLFTPVEQPLNDINDLSALTDNLIEAAYNYCPLEMNIDEIERLCSEENESSPFDQRYVDFLREFVITVDQQGDNCDDLIPYMELQSTVSALSEEELINFDRSRNMLNWFVGSESDLMIDQIRECGGTTEGTRQFLQNIILLEARNACMIPKPPGLLDFDKAKEIAAEVASRYPAMGVMGINNRRDDITRDTIQSFIGPILEDQVSAIAGDNIDVEALMENLPSVQRIPFVKDKRLMDYTSHILGPDLVLEVVDQVIPNLVQNSFEPMLGDLSPTERAVFLQEQLTNPINEAYQNCIAPSKERIRFHDNSLSVKNMIRYRQSIEAQYCESNPETCQNMGCGQSINYFSVRGDINDMAMIQSCLYQSINDEIDKIIGLQLSQQLENLAGLPASPEQIQNALDPIASQALRTCFELKVGEVSGRPYAQTQSAGHPEALLFLDPDTYQNTLLECAKDVERLMTLEVGSLIAAGEPAFHDLFDDQEDSLINGAMLNPQAYQASRQLVSETLNRCLDAQTDHVSHLETNSSLCTPLITMRAGQMVISSQITRMLESESIPQNTVDRISFDYQLCANDVYNQSLDNLFNDQGNPRLTTTEEAETYIDRNTSYLACVNDSILDSVDAVSASAYENILEEHGSAIDQNFARTLTPQLQSQVRNCFEEGLSQNQNWSDFLEFNENSGITGLQARCTEHAEEFVLPRLIENELDRQLVMLRDTNTLALSTDEIIRRIASQSDQTGNTNEILLNVYRDYKSANPDGDVNSFVASFTGAAQLTTMEAIHEHILEEVATRSSIGFPIYERLPDTLTPECLNNFYNIHKDNITFLIESLNENPTSQTSTLDLREIFVEMISDGLYQSLATGEFQGLINDVENMCENPENYRGLDSIVASGVGDDFIAGIIRGQLLESFEQTAQGQCTEELIKLGMRPRVYTSSTQGILSQEQAQQFCSPDIIFDHEMTGLLNQIRSELEDPRMINALNFIWNRKKKTIRLSRSEFTPERIRELFIQDRDVLNFVFDNFVPVVGQNPEKMNELTRIILSKVLEDRTQNSFASEFIEMQVVAAIGLEGYDIARAQLDTEVENLSGFIQGRGFVRERAREFAPEIFQGYWNYNNLRRNFNWRQMSNSRRAMVMRSVVDLNIMPRYDESLSDQERADRSEQLSRIVLGELTEFTERTSQELTEIMTERVNSDVWSDVGSWFNPFD